MTHVFIRQSLEGRKIEITLSPDDLQALGAGSPVQVDDNDSDWDDNTQEIAEGDEEPTAVAQITLFAAKLTGIT